MATPTSDTPSRRSQTPKKRTSAKAIFREPTEDDPRRRITRTPEEMRNIVLTFRVSQRELNELYQFARSQRATMSYMVRQALVETYPDIFADANRYIRKPRKPKRIQDKTLIQKSLVDDTITIVNGSMPESTE